MQLSFLTMPLTTNRLYGYNGSRRYLRPEGRDNKEAFGWEARAQHHGTPLTTPLKVEIWLWWPDKRNRDLDNIKGMLDSLTGILWDDDGQIIDLHIHKGHDKENPRVDIEITELSIPIPSEPNE